MGYDDYMDYLKDQADAAEEDAHNRAVEEERDRECLRTLTAERDEARRERDSLARLLPIEAERDQLRAEVKRLRGELDNAYQDTDYYVQSVEDYGRQLATATARAEAVEALVAVLRDQVGEFLGDMLNCHPEHCDHGKNNPGVCLRSMRESDWDRLSSALALTPAQSLAAIEARVLREVWKKVCAMAVVVEEKESRTYSWSDVAVMINDEANFREEAANG